MFGIVSSTLMRLFDSDRVSHYQKKKFVFIENSWKRKGRKIRYEKVNDIVEL